jgi:hypothetical protein
MALASCCLPANPCGRRNDRRRSNWPCVLRSSRSVAYCKDQEKRAARESLALDRGEHHPVPHWMPPCESNPTALFLGRAEVTPPPVASETHNSNNSTEPPPPWSPPKDPSGEPPPPQWEPQGPSPPELPTNPLSAIPTAERPSFRLRQASREMQCPVGPLEAVGTHPSAFTRLPPYVEGEPNTR